MNSGYKSHCLPSYRLLTEEQVRELHRATLEILETVGVRVAHVLVGLSALLTTTMPKMKEVIESLVEAGLRESVKVMVGGAPVTEKFAKDIGADGYAPNGGEAVAKAKALLAQG